MSDAPDRVTLTGLALAFNRIALSSFGGGLSAWSRQVVVEERRWMSDAEFLSAMTVCRILPGANQVNLAVFVGSKLRGLAVSSAARLDSLPGVPTFAESGVPQLNDPSWFGLVAPARLPEAVLLRVHVAVAKALATGEWLRTALGGLAERHPSVGDVRGLGCFFGIELVKNRETKEMLVPFNASGEAAAPVARVAKAALERGLYLMTHWNVIMVVPPLTITREEAEEGVAILDDVLALADEHYTG